MVTTRGWLQGRAKYLAMAIFNKTKFNLEWEYIYSRLCESIYGEDKDRNLIFVNWSEYQVIRKKIWQECPPKPRTNFDRITESVEALAKMIVQMSLNGDFVPCFYAPDGTEFVMDKERAIQYTIEWLQKECEE